MIINKKNNLATKVGIIQKHLSLELNINDEDMYSNPRDEQSTDH